MKRVNKNEKLIENLQTSQTRIKNYLLFNGSISKNSWVPPLNPTEIKTRTSAQSRMCRLTEILVTELLPYTAQKATKENPENVDLFYKKLDRYDRYMLNGTTLNLTYNPDERKFGCTEIPIVVPFIDESKTSKQYFADGRYSKNCTPLITVTYPDTTGKIIRVDSTILMKMQMVNDIVIRKNNPFTDVTIAAILGMLEETGFGKENDLTILY